jgi:hypothetical protein
MSTATTPANTAGAAANNAARLTSASFGLVVMLIVQFVLGTAQNLYGTAPSPGHSIGIFSSALLGTHFTWGVLTIIASVVFLVQAIRAKAMFAIITGVAGLLALVAAAGAGSSFAQNGANGASFGMALAAAIALLCYSVNVRFLGKGN